MSGTVFFDTQSKVWGTVGSLSDPTSFDDSVIDLQNGTCGFGTGKPACAGDVFWSDLGGVNGGFDAGSYSAHGKAHGYLEYSTEQSAKGLDNATRDDTVFMPLAPPQLVAGAHGKRVVHVHARDTGLITGSAKIVSVGKPMLGSTPCGGGNTKNWNAKYLPGTNPLTVHEDIGGDFTQKAEKAYLWREGKK